MLRFQRKSTAIYPILLFSGLAILCLVGFVATTNTVQLVKTIRVQQERLSFKNKLADVRKVIHQIDADEQYFFITGNPEYFERLKQSAAVLDFETAQLYAQVEKLQRNGKNIQALNFLLNSKRELLANFISQNFSAQLQRQSLANLNSRDHRQMMADLRRVLAALDLAETQAITQQGLIVDRYSLVSMITIIVGLLIAIVLVAIFGWRSWQEIERRSRTEKELLRAQEAAVVSSRLKSQFLATVSHEIRTPLNGIIGLSDLLKEQVKSPEEKRLVNIIHSSGKSLLRIVNDILDFSKIEAGKIELEIQRFSLRTVLQSSLELHNVKARDKGLYLMSHIDKRMPTTLFGDSSRLIQILNNLISNAIKFTDRGEIVVLCRLLKEEGAKVHLRITVEDSGRGIPESEQVYLFQPFNQLANAQTSTNEGTGLGLSISKTIVEKMGGRIWLESEVGRGSKFSFEVSLDKAGDLRLQDSLPAVDFENMVYAGPSNNVRFILDRYAQDLGIRFYCVSTLEELTELKAKLGRMAKSACFYHYEDARFDSDDFAENLKPICLVNSAGAHIVQPDTEDCVVIHFPLTRLKVIETLLQEKAASRMIRVETPAAVSQRISDNESLVLIVEDNTTNQILAQSYLERFGIRSHIAANGQEALDAIERTDYDAILMDCRMPVMDGFQATDEIRKREANLRRRTPIIAMTAHAMEGDRERCLSSGMDDYLSKPFEPDDLKTALSKWIHPKSEIQKDVLETLASKTSQEVVFKMSVSFISTLATSLAELEKAKPKADLQTIRFHSHKLKSSSAVLGALRLSAYCSAVEAAAEKGWLDHSNLDAILASGKRTLNELYGLTGRNEGGAAASAAETVEQKTTQTVTLADNPLQ